MKNYLFVLFLFMGELAICQNKIKTYSVNGISIFVSSTVLDFSSKFKQDIPVVLQQREFLPGDLVFNTWDGRISESNFGLSLHFQKQDSLRKQHEIQFGIENSRQSVHWFTRSDTTSSLFSRSENFYIKGCYFFSFVSKEKFRLYAGGLASIGFQISMLSEFSDPITEQNVILYGKRASSLTLGLPIQAEFRVLRLFFIRLGPQWGFSYRKLDGIGGGVYQHGFYTSLKFEL